MANADGKFAAYGNVLGYSASEFIIQVNSHSANRHIVCTWLAGYFSAYNFVCEGVVNILDGGSIDDVVLFLGEYLKRNPLDNVGDALSAFLDYAHDRQSIIGSQSDGET